MFLEAGGDGEDVQVERDVERIESLPHEEPVRALADLDLASGGVRLAPFVEGHHDDRRAVAADGPRLAQEVVLALLETDRVGDRLALDAGQPGFDHRPLRAVHHDRQPGDFRLGRHHVEERGHRRFRVEHPLVHVDVEDVGAATHLLERDRRRLGVIAVGNQPREALRSGDVGPLADQNEIRVWPDGQRLEAGILCELFRDAGSGVRGGRPRPGWERLDGIGNRPDVSGRCPATAADDVENPGLGELAEQSRRFRRRLVVLAEGVWQARVGVARDVLTSDARQFGDVRAHLAGAERAVDPHAERPGMPDRDVERVEGLPRERPSTPVGDRH